MPPHDPNLSHRYRVPHGGPSNLNGIDPAGTLTYDGSKKDSLKAFEAYNARLEALQELLYADGRHKLLVVFQGIDTSGKDGSIRHIFDRVNPAGVRVASFKKPTAEELGHDYLWRVHKHTPQNGEIVIFNRSHYEDVLVVRVHGLVPEERWRKRYEHINAFEKLLADEGTTILKFFLHITKDEQKERLEERLKDPAKHWKFDVNDLKERARWDDYTAAYEEALARTSTPWAPWYVIPANKKWYRNLVISSVLVDTLERLNLRPPPAPEGLSEIVVE
jgi:PPK2 family polyphosphate:nucleotide phosphotransferase